MSREWVTVPAEPTPEMVEEICRSHTTEEWPNAFGASAQEIRRDYARAGWAAALAAAPHPPIAPDALRAAAEKARAALSDLLLRRDPIVYSDALRALDEALAGASAQPQAAGWRQIETAPRDGTTVIVARHMGDFGWIRGCASWVGGTGFVAGWVSKGFDPVMGELGLAHPTHWQPLPEPPKEGA